MHVGSINRSRGGESLQKRFSFQADGRALAMASGYQAKFVSFLLDRYLCSICKLAMKNPVQTECGHLFCRVCLDAILVVANPLCPVDNAIISRDGVRVIYRFHSIITFSFFRHFCRFSRTMLAKERYYLCRCTVTTRIMAAPGLEH